MKNSLLTFFRWLFSFFSIFFQMLLSLVRVILYSKLKTKCEKLLDMKESTFILGNGRSLKNFIEENNNFLNTKNIIVVNDFFLSEYFMTLRPNVYVIADPAYWELQVTEEMSVLRESLIKRLLVDVNWEIQFFVPSAAYQAGFFQRAFDQNKLISVQPFNTASFSGITSVRYFFYDKLLAKPFSGNVIGSALFIALQMDIKEIYLFGVEHSWTQSLFVDEHNRTCIKDEHFYQNPKNAKVWLKANTIPYKISEALSDIANMLGGYYEINEYAIHKNVKIFNCTPNSFIDAFERKKWEKKD